MTRTDEHIRRTLQLLGLARKSGKLLIGQDSAFKRRAPMLFVTSGDCSRAVLRKVAARTDGGTSRHISVPDITREDIGAAAGVCSAQIFALPLDSGFADKIVDLLEQGAR